MVGERLPWIPYAVLLPILLIISWIYSLLIRLRNGCYHRSILRSHSVDAKVVSVGNLTVGGTGKTPLVERIAVEAVKRGFKTGVVSRGYKGEAAGLNDEGKLLNTRVPDLVLVQDPDRVAAARRAVDRGADFIIMDDGFQHRRLKRDLDIVVVDATRPFGYGRVLPAGLLREPLSGLARADAVVLSRCDQAKASRLNEIESLCRGKPTFRTVHAPRPSPTLDGEEVWLVSGIANPAAFERTAVSMGMKVAGHSVFPDHHGYTSSDVEEVLRQASNRKVVTTAKDGIKLEDLPEAEKMIVLDIEVTFIDGEEAFFQLVFG